MFRLSQPDKEGHLQTSRPLFARALLSGEAMQELLHHLGPHTMVYVRGLAGENEMLNNSFLQDYKRYIAELLEGGAPAVPASFTAAIGSSQEDFYAFEARPGRFLIKAVRPVIQMRPFSFSFSEKDGKFYPRILGETALSWGVEFSFPQMARLSSGGPIIKPFSDGSPNGLLFKELMRWVRRHSAPHKGTARIGKDEIRTYLHRR